MSFSESLAAGHRGFGAMSGDEFEMLRKAIDSGYDVGGATQAGGAAWRLEFLENTLAILTQQARHIVFYNDIPKVPATSTAVEYARRTGLGDMMGGWYASGELPLSHDSEYDRQVGLIKFLGDVREIKMPFLLVRTLVDQRNEVTQAGTLWLLSNLERTLFKGNAKLGVAGAEFEEIDGMETYIERDAPADNIINLYGAPLEEGHIRNAGQVVIAGHGVGSHIYAPTEILEDYSASYLKQQFIPTPVAGGGLAAGLRIDRLMTVGGDYLLRPLFLYKGLTRELPSISASSSAPAPSPTVVLTGFQASTLGEWGNSIGLGAAGVGSAGLVEYQVAYGNKFGEQVPTLAAPASLAVPYANRDDLIRITVTNPAGFVSEPKYISVYRRDTYADGTQSPWGCVKRMPVANVTPGGTTVFDDDGSDMPGMARAFFGELNQNVIHMSQLLPFTRIPLPALSLAERFALVMFVAMIMRITNRWVMFKNVGRRTV